MVRNDYFHAPDDPSFCLRQGFTPLGGKFLLPHCSRVIPQDELQPAKPCRDYVDLRLGFKV